MKTTLFTATILLALLFAFNSCDDDEVITNNVWTGADMTFTKADSSDWTLEANQDRLTNNVRITRQNKKAIYNYKWWQDNFSADATIEDLSFDFWNDDWAGTVSQTFTATGGTKGVKWALLDDTGSSADWSSYNFGTLGDPTNFHSFNNIIQIIEILEEETGDFSTITVTDDFEVSFDGDTFSSPDVGDFIVGKKFGVWLVDDNIYLSLKFNSWKSSARGGGFSYVRSTMN